MKKILLFAAAAVLAAGCASSASKTQRGDLSAEDAKYQIIDQEFDNMPAPQDNYENIPPYEDQVGASSYIQSVQKRGSNKPMRKAAAVPPASKASSVTDEETLTAGR